MCALVTGVQTCALPVCALAVPRLSDGGLADRNGAADRAEYRQFGLLRTGLCLCAGAGAAASARGRGLDHAVRTESDRAWPRALSVRRILRRVGIDLWRGKRALRPLWRGLAGPYPRLLLLARQPAAQGRTQVGLSSDRKSTRLNSSH